MPRTDEDNIRQDEDISAGEFADEETRDYRFGNWPEVFGLALTLVLIWLTFSFTG